VLEPARDRRSHDVPRVFGDRAARVGCEPEPSKLLPAVALRPGRRGGRRADRAVRAALLLLGEQVAEDERLRSGLVLLLELRNEVHVERVVQASLEAVGREHARLVRSRVEVRVRVRVRVRFRERVGVRVRVRERKRLGFGVGLARRVAESAAERAQRELGALARAVKQRALGGGQGGLVEGLGLELGVRARG